MTTETLNKIARLLDTTDKHLVFTVAIKGLMQLGMSLEDALDEVLGEGTYDQLRASYVAAIK